MNIHIKTGRLLVGLFFVSYLLSILNPNYGIGYEKKLSKGIITKYRSIDFTIRVIHNIK